MHQTQFSQKIPYGGFSQIRSPIRAVLLKIIILASGSPTINYYSKLTLHDLYRKFVPGIQHSLIIGISHKGQILSNDLMTASALKTETMH